MTVVSVCVQGYVNAFLHVFMSFNDAGHHKNTKYLMKITVSHTREAGIIRVLSHEGEDRYRGKE